MTNRSLWTLYTDRLDGRISPPFYDAKAGEIRAQQQTILRRIEQIQSNEPAPTKDALNLMDLTPKAAALFREQNGHEQHRLPRTLIITAAWPGGELRMEFEEPFEILRGLDLVSRSKEMEKTGSERDSKI